MPISTKTGDLGTTDLAGQRVSKNEAVIETLGLIDHIIAMIAYQSSKVCEFEKDAAWHIEHLSLFCAILSGYTPYEKWPSYYLEKIEEDIQSMEKQTAGFRFIFPLDNECAAGYNLIRVIIRNAERAFVGCTQYGTFDLLAATLNRLSDWFYLKTCITMKCK